MATLASGVGAGKPPHLARDIDSRKVAWLAGAYAAGERCRGPLRGQSLARLRALAAEVRNAQPEGGTTERTIALEQARCR